MNKYLVVYTDKEQVMNFGFFTAKTEEQAKRQATHKFGVYTIKLKAFLVDNIQEGWVFYK